MKKLIMVGMRYQDPASVKKYKEELKNKGTLKVSLHSEHNTQGVKGVAVGVYVEGTGVKLGYIRNADLAELFRTYPKLSTGGTIITDYHADRAYDNYWLLLKNESVIPAISVSSVSWAKKIDVTLNTLNTLNESKTETFYKDEPKMKLANSMRDSFFREVTNVAIDIQSGKFGVVSADGIAVYSNGGVSVNPITDLGVKVPAYAFRVAVADLKEGDIILNGNETTFFKSKAKDADTYEVVSLNGEVKTVGNVTNMFFGKNTVLAVRNMFGEGMNPLMLAMLAGDGKMDNKNLMLAMAMGGGFGGNSSGFGEMNPLMLMMLMKD